MEVIAFIETKIDETIKLLASYKVKETLEPWEEICMEGVELELENYQKVLSNLKVWEQVKNGKLEVA